jgi:hypothetical protein
MAAAMGVHSRKIVCGQLCRSPATYVISEERKSCVFSTKLHKNVTAAGFGHHEMFQIVL